MLTDAAIRRLKPRDKAFKAADMYGLYLLVKPNGALYWRMDFRHAGRRGTLALGVYPKVSLKEARQKREGARKLLDQGTNPSTYKKLTNGLGSAFTGDSFHDVAEEWLAKMEAEGRSPATLEKMRWLLSFAEPLIGERPIGEIAAPEFLTATGFSRPTPTLTNTTSTSPGTSRTGPASRVLPG